MRFLFVVHKNEEKAEQNSVLFHRLTLKERGLRPNGYFPLMRQPLCFHTKTGGIRTREGMSVIRMSGEHSNSEWSEGDRAGAEEAACKQGAAGGQIPSTAP